ncbi:MAG: hypothetical protein IJ513_06615 [Bacteroidaceae bacterium]|nr:hypothetical protein [Bacteroidaceae bacterium]
MKNTKRNGEKAGNKELIVEFCTTKGIALYDTACEVRRLKDNASDKFLEIVTPTDIRALLSALPHCTAIVTTGQKATEVITETFGCEKPSVGSMTTFTANGRELHLWRMPSSSRAYPLPIERKALHYLKMLQIEGIQSLNN